MTRAALGLGANLGDARATLRAAVAGLGEADGVEVLAVSGLWGSAPVGGPDQPDYTNAVVLVRADGGPEALLALAHQLEAAAARTREERWGPRTLDVDVLDVLGERRDTPELTVPHPRAHERRFVLEPWAQVDAAWALRPEGHEQRPVRAWAEDLRHDRAQRLELLDDGAWWR
jgi:2-amino-4-hydroxy-6-hydroxymethyldihydropteridine diphosphokinase